jgi:hypothetical protein
MTAALWGLLVSMSPGHREGQDELCSGKHIPTKPPTLSLVRLRLVLALVTANRAPQAPVT